MNTKSRAFYYYIGFTVLFVTLNIITPPNKAVLHQYHISAIAGRLLSSSVVFPLILIWFAAFYGFAKLGSYAKLIKKSKDGKSVATIARGLMWLALWLPVSANISIFMSLWTEHHPGFAQASSTISGYVGLIITMVGFLIIGGGARKLTDNIKQRPSRLSTMAVALFLATIGVVYCYFVFSAKHLVNIYHLPIWVLVFSVIVPYLFTWFVGLLGALELRVYARRSPGVIYRESWRMLSVGLGWVILTSITLQYVTTLTNRLTHLRISAILVILYLLLIMLALGYVMIALGAKKLRKIEEV